VILSDLKDGTAFRVVLMLCMNNLEKVHGLSIYTQCNGNCITNLRSRINSNEQKFTY